MGDPIRRSPRGLRRQHDPLIRVVNVMRGEFFVLHSQMYRTIKADEFAGSLWAPGFALSPHEATHLLAFERSVLNKLGPLTRRVSCSKFPGCRHTPRTR